jgi:hypothetical protein
MPISLQSELSTARQAITAHWKSCESVGLQHNAQNLEPVLAALTSYATTLEQLPDGHGDKPVLDAMQKFYASAHELNAKHDDGLLETDERELIVPVLIRFAELAGIDSAKYDGEPGSEFRDF